jgi:hypothetical protein
MTSKGLFEVSLVSKPSSQRRLVSRSSAICQKLDSSLRWNDEQRLVRSFFNEQAVIPAQAGIQFFCNLPETGFQPVRVKVRELRVLITLSACLEK